MSQLVAESSITVTLTGAAPGRQIVAHVRKPWVVSRSQQPRQGRKNSVESTRRLGGRLPNGARSPRRRSYAPSGALQRVRFPDGLRRGLLSFALRAWMAVLVSLLLCEGRVSGGGVLAFAAFRVARVLAFGLAGALAGSGLGRFGAGQFGTWFVGFLSGHGSLRRLAAHRGRQRAFSDQAGIWFALRFVRSLFRSSAETCRWHFRQSVRMLERSHSPPPSATGTTWSASQRCSGVPTRAQTPCARRNPSLRLSLAELLGIEPQSAQTPWSRANTVLAGSRGPCAASIRGRTRRSRT